MAESLRLDVHPVEVYVEGHDEVTRAARAFVTDRRVVVYRESVDEVSGRARPVVALSAEITGEAPEPHMGKLQSHRAIETALGTLHLNPAAGCGCGSVLKALDLPGVGW